MRDRPNDYPSSIPTVSTMTRQQLTDNTPQTGPGCPACGFFFVSVVNDEKGRAYEMCTRCDAVALIPRTFIV